MVFRGPFGTRCSKQDPPTMAGSGLWHWSPFRRSAESCSDLVVPGHSGAMTSQSFKRSKNDSLGPVISTLDIMSDGLVHNGFIMEPVDLIDQFFFNGIIMNQ